MSVRRLSVISTDDKLAPFSNLYFIFANPTVCRLIRRTFLFASF